MSKCVVIRQAQPDLERQVRALILLLESSEAGQKKDAPGVEAWNWYETAIKHRVPDDTSNDPASTSPISRAD